MNLHLQHVRTGDTLEPIPARTLIGAADYANIETDDSSPYLGALLVRYPGAWALYCLSDEGVTFNRRLLHPGERVLPGEGDVLGVGDERYTFVEAPDSDDSLEIEADSDALPAACFAYVTNPDGMEECRAVDHNILFGRLEFCHVQLADTRLSRVNALLAAYGGRWYVHTLSKKPIGLNRKAVHDFSRVADGDELLIGPLVIRLELRPNTAERAALAPTAGSRERPPLSDSIATDLPELTDTPAPGDSLDLLALHASGQQLDRWLRRQPVPAAAAKTGLGSWFGMQKDRLKRFWLDTPETTAARSLRTSGRAAEAFAVLDKAIRARPDGPELLRELFRLYEGLGLFDLCYRPLRHIEKLAEARGGSDPWVLEALARLCERLGPDQPDMYDRAVAYWTKLETTTGTSYLRQRSDLMARRALRESGFAGAEEG